MGGLGGADGRDPRQLAAERPGPSADLTDPRPDTASVPDDFVVARNPDAASALPYLLRVPLGPDGVVLKAREPWPRTAKVYCHRAEGWPDDADVVERVAVRSCARRGPAVDLVLDRPRENRSQFVFTRLKDGRDAVFWQSPRTTAKARPGVRLPTARASGVDGLAVVVDSRERYGYRFAHQQVTTTRAALPAGDYGVRDDDGRWVAVVERKSLEDLARSLVDGSLPHALGELAAVGRAAVVVEERWSRLFRLEHVRPSYVADLLARVQVRWPTVPVVFAETRPLAEEWTYRFLGAALSEHVADGRLEERLDDLAPAGPLEPAPPAPPSTAEVRAWALAAGYDVADRGRLPGHVVQAFEGRHQR